jgi:hypothetical protein
MLEAEGVNRHHVPVNHILDQTVLENGLDVGGVSQKVLAQETLTAQLCSHVIGEQREKQAEALEQSVA